MKHFQRTTGIHERVTEEQTSGGEVRAGGVSQEGVFVPRPEGPEVVDHVTEHMEFHAEGRTRAKSRGAVVSGNERTNGAVENHGQLWCGECGATKLEKRAGATPHRAREFALCWRCRGKPSEGMAGACGVPSDSRMLPPGRSMSVLFLPQRFLQNCRGRGQEDRKSLGVHLQPWEMESGGSFRHPGGLEPLCLP